MTFRLWRCLYSENHGKWSENENDLLDPHSEALWGGGGEFLQQTLSGLFTVYFCLRLLFCECNLGPADLPKKTIYIANFPLY